MTFSSEEIERYKRHLVLKEIGGPGQQAIREARVLVVGAGGLGSPALLYLAAAGVGTLGVVDDDAVSLDNLQRQIIHGTPDVGCAKVQSASNAVSRLNPHVLLHAHAVRLDLSNADELISAYDIVADGSDNFATRYLVSEVCERLRKTLVFAAAGRFDGYVTTLKPHVCDADGRRYPSFRSIFPEAPPPGTVPNCSEVGVLGSVVGVLGALQATEVIKEITGAGETLAGRLLIYDALDTRMETINLMDTTRSASPPISGT